MSLSSISAQWEWLFSLYLSLGVAIGAMVLALLLFLVIRYRASSTDRKAPNTLYPETEGSGKGGLKATLLMTSLITIVLFGLTVGTMDTVNLIEKIPDNALTIKVTGFQWGWRFTYPDGRVSIGELRVPSHGAVILQVTSEDVFHAIGIPDLKIKVDAIPGKVNKIWFAVSEECFTECKLAIRCYELCGVGHALMTAKLIVMDPLSFANWYAGG